MLEEVAALRTRMQKMQAKKALMAERAAAHKAKLDAAHAISVARDRRIAEQQREARKRRLYAERVSVKQQFDSEWEIK